MTEGPPINNRERRLKPAIDAFANFPVGFTESDDAMLRPIESQFTASFTRVLTAMTPFLPPAVRVLESGSHADYYVTDEQRVLGVDARDFGFTRTSRAAGTFFPEYLGYLDVDYLDSLETTLTGPVVDYTVSDIYNETPYRLDQKIGFVSRKLAPHLQEDAFTSPDYIAAIGDMRRSIGSYMATVDTIASAHVPEIRSAAVDFAQKLAESEDSSLTDLEPLYVPLFGKTNFELDVSAGTLRRFRSITNDYDQVIRDPADPGRDATAVEWCVLAPILKYNILSSHAYQIHAHNEIDDLFGTDFAMASESRYLMLPSLWETDK